MAKYKITGYTRGDRANPSIYNGDSEIWRSKSRRNRSIVFLNKRIVPFYLAIWDLKIKIDITHNRSRKNPFLYCLAFFFGLLLRVVRKINENKPVTRWESFDVEFEGSGPGNIRLATTDTDNYVRFDGFRVEGGKIENNRIR